MRKIIITWLLAIFTTIFGIAQKARGIDSLENVLKTQKLTPSRQLGIYDTICRLSINHDLDKLMEYAEKGLLLANKVDDKVNIMDFNENCAMAYSIKVSYDTALIYYEKALNMAIKMKDKGREASQYEGMGILSWHQNKQTLSLEYFLKALSIFEDLGDKKRSISTLGNISSLHRALKNYDKAIYYSEKSKILAEELKDWNKSLLAYYNLSNIYLDKKEYDKALDYAKTALEKSRFYGNKYIEMVSLQTLSNIYSYGFMDYDKALEYLNESIKAGNEYGDPATLYYSLCTMSDVYRKQKRWKECENTALKAWAIDSTNTDGSISLVTDIIVSNIYLNNKEKAESFLWKYKELNDQYFDKDYRETILDMETKYETEKKEMRIAALEKEQKLYRWLGIATAAALLLGLGLVFYFHRSNKQKRKITDQQIKQLEQEKELMKQEEKLIAARATLDAEKTEREIIARDLHDEVGTMLHVVKNNMDIYSMKSYSIIENTEISYFNEALSVLDKAITGLRRVAHHIMPAILIEKGLLTALDDFCRSIPEAEFHVSGNDRRFDSDKEIALYRCAYELVNNAMRHGKASRIEVHLNQDEKTVYLSVVDNGCGFNPQTASMGMGIKNLQTRLSAFSGRMEIYSEPGKGAEINVEMNI